METRIAHGSTGSHVGRMVLVAVLATTAMWTLSLSFLTSSRFPAASLVWNTLEALTWMGLAAGVHRRNPALIRRSLSALMICKGLYQATLFLVQAPDAWPAVGAMRVAICIALGVGLWQAREWSRWGVGAWGLLQYGLVLASASFAYRMVLRYEPDPAVVSVGPWYFALIALSVLPSVGLAIYSVLPSTIRHFAEARREAPFAVA